MNASTVVTSSSTTTRRMAAAAAAVATLAAVVLGGGTVLTNRSATAAPSTANGAGTGSVSGVHAAHGSSSSVGGTGAGEKHAVIQLAPYTTNIGAVVTPGSSMDAFLTASVLDVDASWKRLFKSWGFNAPAVTYQWPLKGESIPTQCTGGPSNDTTLVYCSRDDTITISQELARNLWLGQYGTYHSTATGDMSVSLFVAHEYGHNIENELGWLDKITGAQAERGADCFAGVWAKDAADRGILDAGDIDEGLAALDLLAEHEGQSDNGLHGTPAERQGAFRVGFGDGAASCVNTYFK